MYQNNVITSQIRFKHYLQRCYSLLLYVAKIKIVIKVYKYEYNCIYNILQKYNIDTMKVLLTVGLRPTERLRGLQQTERLANRVLTDRTTSRVQHNRTIPL